MNASRGGPNWIAQVIADFDRIRALPPAQGHQALQKEIEKHLALLQEDPAGGAWLPLDRHCSNELSNLFVHPSDQMKGSLGVLRVRAKSTAQQHSNEFGVATTLKLLKFLPNESGCSDTTSRLGAAGGPAHSSGLFSPVGGRRPRAQVILGTLPFAREIEFPRACDDAQAFIEHRYQPSRCRTNSKNHRAVSRYIGASEQGQLPELANVGTLHDALYETCRVS